MAARLHLLGLTVLFGLLSIAAAQTSDLDALAAAYPACSLECMIEYIPQSACMTTDGLNQTCVCTDEGLNQDIRVCAVQSCTVKEMLTTMKASSLGCQRPVRDHSMDMTIIGFAVGGFALLTFGIRLVTRLSTNAGTLYADDWLMLAAVIATGPPTVFAWFLTQNGLGRDIWMLEFYQVTNVLEFFFLGELFYFIGLTLIKISILAFFYRIFPVRSLQRIIIFVMAVCAAYGISFFFATLFQCQPINYMWHQWHREMPGKCNNFHLQGFVAAGISIALDLVILVLPLKQLYGLELSLQKRISIMLMFAVGWFACIIAIIRLKYLVQFRHTENPTYDYYAPGYWSLVECQVGIICANMPAIYQLIKIWKPKLVSGTSRGTRTKSSRSRSGGTAPTPEIKGSIVNGRFTPSVAPRIRTMPHERSDSTEYLKWGKELDGNTIELAPTSKGSISPPLNHVPPGQAF